MGTRSLTTIKEDGKALVKIYRQFDGYPEGHGRDLFDILQGRTMVNGIPGDVDPTRVFNGSGCMAAQIIRQLKDDGAGGIYVASLDDDGEFCDYRYTIETTTAVTGWTYSVSPPRLVVECYEGEIFAGTVEEFGKWIETVNNEVGA